MGKNDVEKISLKAIRDQSCILDQRFLIYTLLFWSLILQVSYLVDFIWSFHFHLCENDAYII